MGQDKPFYRKATGNRLDLKVRWGRAWGNHQVGAISVSQVDRVSDMISACWLRGSAWGGLRKGTMASASTSVREKASFQLLPWCQMLQFFPVCLWCLSICCLCPGAQREWVWVCLCKPFKRICQGVQQFLSPPASIPTGFYSQNLWRLIFLALEAWDGRPTVGLGPLTPKISPWFLSATHGCGTSSFCVYAPSTSLCVVYSLIP